LPYSAVTSKFSRPQPFITTEQKETLIQAMMAPYYKGYEPQVMEDTLRGSGKRRQSVGPEVKVDKAMSFK
jgi:hypothetical protein